MKSKDENIFLRVMFFILCYEDSGKWTKALFLKAIVYSAFEYWSRDFTLSKGNGWIFSFSNTLVQFESIATPKVNYSSSADKELELSPNWRIITRWTLRIILLKSDSGNEEIPFHHQINQFRFRGKIALGGNRLVKVYS